MDSTIIGLIIGVILVVITVILIFWGSGKENTRIEEVRRSAPEVKVPPVNIPEVAVPKVSVPDVRVAAEQAVPPRMDDLTVIEGIGPRISGILNQNGITTFAQLAATELAVLEKMLKDHGMQFTKPGSWAEQARLAADGKMDELKALQDKLVAGR